MRDIFVPIFLSSLGGLVLAHHMSVPSGACLPMAWLTFTVSLALFWLDFHRWSLAGFVLAFALLLSSFHLAGLEGMAPPIREKFPSQTYVSIDGVLMDFPEIRETDSIVLIRATQVAYYKTKRAVRRNIRMRVNGDLRFLMRGDRVNIQARVSIPSFNINFFPSPFSHYYLYKKIHLNGYSKSRQLVRVTQSAHVLWRLIGGWRNSIRGVLEKKFPRSGGGLNREGVFLEAILIGDRGRLGDALEEDLKRAGVFHLFAISGAHIGIIALLAMVALKWLGCPLPWRIAATILLLMTFLTLSGFRISAQRAVLMAVPLLLSRYFFYRVRIFNILSLSGIVILCFNPAEFLDPGFVLTFVLTAAIVQGRVIWDRCFRALPAAVKELISANISASLVAIPFSLFYFKRYSFTAVLAGVVLVPLTAIILMFGAVVILTAPVSAPFCQLVLGIADPFLGLFFVLVDFFSTNLNLSIFRASPPIVLVMVVPVLFFLMGVPVRFKLQKFILPLLLGALLVWMSAPSPHYRPDGLQAFFLDVGQGDAAVVAFPSGQSLLIDGGGSYSGFTVGKNLVHPFLLQKGLRVNWIAVSHYHPDHCRGITEIIQAIKPDEVWLSSIAAQNSDYRRLIESLPPGTEIRYCLARDRRIVGECQVVFLHPPALIRAGHTHNNHSQIIHISGPHHSFLFTGDIEMGVEVEVCEQFRQQLRADVLKVPHHGSKTSSSEAFLDAVGPRLALFSHSSHNRFNFPHPLVRRRYFDRRIHVLSTARHGGISVISLPGRLCVTVSK